MNWKSWFAWYPVKLQLDNELKRRTIWFRLVEYKQYQLPSIFGEGAETVTHYRLPDNAPEFKMPK